MSYQEFNVVMLEVNTSPLSTGGMYELFSSPVFGNSILMVIAILLVVNLCLQLCILSLLPICPLKMRHGVMSYGIEGKLNLPKDKLRANMPLSSDALVEKSNACFDKKRYELAYVYANEALLANHMNVTALGCRYMALNAIEASNDQTNKTASLPSAGMDVDTRIAELKLEGSTGDRVNCYLTKEDGCEITPYVEFSSLDVFLNDKVVGAVNKIKIRDARIDTNFFSKFAQINASRLKVDELLLDRVDFRWLPLESFNSLLNGLLLPRRISFNQCMLPSGVSMNELFDFKAFKDSAGASFTLDDDGLAKTSPLNDLVDPATLIRYLHHGNGNMERQLDIADKYIGPWSKVYPFIKLLRNSFVSDSTASPYHLKILCFGSAAKMPKKRKFRNFATGEVLHIVKIKRAESKYAKYHACKFLEISICRQSQTMEPPK